MDGAFRTLFASPIIRPELKADVYGLSSAPGVVEVVARVIMDVSQLHEIQPGEILVTPYTMPAWTSAFARIEDVVTDHGGALTHAAIVGRGYGIPVFVGTGYATGRIKPGQRIRVDGNKGVVYVVEK
jgi:pyruvate,water dikinase